jgi:hypothetical protein
VLTLRDLGRRQRGLLSLKLLLHFDVVSEHARGRREVQRPFPRYLILTDLLTASISWIAHL